MFSKFIPDYIYDSAYELDPEFFLSKGINGIIFDIDNTLVRDGIKVPDEKTIAFLKGFCNADIKLAIASNNSKERAEVFCAPLGIYFTYKSGKPKLKSFREISEYMQLSPEKIAVVGDQILTDMLMAKRGGALAVMTKPIHRYENAFFVLKRFLERPFIWYYYKKGKEKR